LIKKKRETAQVGLLAAGAPPETPISRVATVVMEVSQVTHTGRDPSHRSLNNHKLPHKTLWSGSLTWGGPSRVRERSMHVCVA